MHKLLNKLAILATFALSTSAFAQASKTSYFETNLVRTTAIVSCEAAGEDSGIEACGYDLVIQVELEDGTIKSLPAEVNEAGGIRVGSGGKNLLIGRLTEKEVEAIVGAKKRIKDNLYKRLSGHRIREINKLEVDVAGAIYKNFAIAYGTRTEKKLFRSLTLCRKSPGDLFYERNCRKNSERLREVRSNIWRVQVGKKHLVFNATDGFWD